MNFMKTIYSLVLTILLSPLAWSQSTNLKVGDKAPDFELQDQDGLCKGHIADSKERLGR